MASSWDRRTGCVVGMDWVQKSEGGRRRKEDRQGTRQGSSSFIYASPKQPDREDEPPWSWHPDSGGVCLKLISIRTNGNAGPWLEEDSREEDSCESAPHHQAAADWLARLGFPIRVPPVLTPQCPSAALRDTSWATYVAFSLAPSMPILVLFPAALD